MILLTHLILLFACFVTNINFQPKQSPKYHSVSYKKHLVAADNACNNCLGVLRFFQRKLPFKFSLAPHLRLTSQRNKANIK